MGRVITSYGLLVILGVFLTTGQGKVKAQLTFDGMIYSFVLDSQGNVTGYSISAIPEPSAMGLLVTCVLLGGLRRRRIFKTVPSQSN